MTIMRGERPLRVGIIGLGVGEQHIWGYERHPACEVAVLCDFDAEKREAMAARYPGKRVVATDREILEDPSIQVVSVASYDDHHHAQVEAALRSGKHVFVEKPLCIQEDHARAIRRRLQENPHLKISTNLILRRCPRFAGLREMVGRGELGTLFHVEGDYNYGRIQKITGGWRGRVPGYSVMLGGGVHMIDLLQWISRDEVVEVAAVGNRISTRGTGFKSPDMVTAILTFRSGMTGKVSANFGCVMPHFHGLTLYGTRATFVNGVEGGRLHVSRDAAEPARILDLPYPGVHKGELIYSFVESIMGTAPPEVGADDVFRSLSVCFSIDRAWAEGRPVAVTYI